MSRLRRFCTSMLLALAVSACASDAGENTDCEQYRDDAIERHLSKAPLPDVGGERQQAELDKFRALLRKAHGPRLLAECKAKREVTR